MTIALADEDPNQHANDVIPRQWVTVLARVRKRSVDNMTIGQFVKHLAGLGGHLARKRDGHPGWITLWRGLEKLLLILGGASL